jgi:O-antigen biosynthesis protein
MKNMFSNLFRMTQQAINVAKTEGLYSLWTRIHRRIFNNSMKGLGLIALVTQPKTDVLSFYDFVLTKNYAATLRPPFNHLDKSINWLIPDFGIGSGGHLNIFRFIHMLEQYGYRNTICVIGENRHTSPASARQIIRENFFPLNASVVFGVDALDSAKFSFATSWITAYALRGFSKTAHKLYFIQDFEPAFYAYGSEYDFALATYSFGFTGVCSGDWLATLLKKDYGMTCHTIGFSYDSALYQPTVRREPQVRRVFCYCRPPTIRRGLETALLALHIVGLQLPDVKFVFAGWDMSNYHFPHPHLNAGTLSLKELPDLYSQCDVALVLSFTNLSLLPLELMACGCAVVSNRGANVEWLLSDINCVLSDSNPNSIADSIIRTLEQDDYRSNLNTQAMHFARTTSWDKEGTKLDLILQSF